MSIKPLLKLLMNNQLLALTGSNALLRPFYQLNYPVAAKECGQDVFAADYQEDEYKLLGMAIKYAGLRGKEVRVIGKNWSSFAEEERIR